MLIPGSNGLTQQFNRVLIIISTAAVTKASKKLKVKKKKKDLLIMAYIPGTKKNLRV